MYRKALAAFDLVDAAGTSLIARRCASLTEEQGCTVAMISVRLPLPASYTQHLPKHWEAGQFSETESSLYRIARDHGFESEVTSVLAPAGSVSNCVVDAVGETDADVIIVGAHRVDIKRLVLGSNTLAIVRDAPCDVIVVRGPQA